ncbi:MAG: DUF2797 domain-containing protein [Desulfurococcales archaeon]|nr:DUF2797 domain-containing protein [Desulfurococcales archaeon]
MILRLVVKKTAFIESKEIRTGLLSEGYMIDMYSVEPSYLLLQYPESIEVTKGELDRFYRVKRGPWIQYCRWHSGPIDRKDDPLERIYCNINSDSYCRQHKRTTRALYELCVTLHGDKGLEICKLLDKKVSTEYVVYLTDFGGSKPKVGMTRSFRFVERLAEQAHIVATPLLTTNSAYEARRLEIKISASGLAQEIKRRTLRVNRSIGESAARLSYWAKRISEALGIDWGGRLLRVTPPDDLQYYMQTDPQKIAGMPFIVKGFWGGYLLVEAREGRKYAINTRVLQHRDSLDFLD